MGGADCAKTTPLRSCAPICSLVHGEQLSFVHLDFSNGLPVWDDATFDGCRLRLAIQYAEHYSEERGGWTTDAYAGC